MHQLKSLYPRPWDKMNETWGAGIKEDAYFEKASLFSSITVNCQISS